MESKKLLLDAEAQQGPAHGWRVLVKDEGLAVFTNKVHTAIKTSPSSLTVSQPPHAPLKIKACMGT